MALKEALLAELKHESGNTKKILERLPADKYDWKPHEKSMTAGRLASHIAEIPVWVNRILEGNEFDFASLSPVRNTYENTAALLEVFNEKLTAAQAALEATTDEAMNEKFTIRRGAQIVYELPRKVALRSIAFNHIWHHRGQLSVFLRLLDVPVPGMYGPSADEI